MVRRTVALVRRRSSHPASTALPLLLAQSAGRPTSAGGLQSATLTDGGVSSASWTGRIPLPIPAGCCTHEARVLSPCPGCKAPAHRVLGDRVPEQVLDASMDFGRAHRQASRRKHVGDCSLHHAIAESAARRLRLRTCSRTDRPIRQGLEHRL
jgi:hypothetical protein